MQGHVQKAGVFSKQLCLYLLWLAPFLAVVLSSQASAIPQVQERFDQIADSRAGATTTHRFGFRYTDLASQVGSVSFEFCSNSPLAEIPCVAPNGLDVTGASLITQDGQVGFSISGSDTTVNKLVIRRSPQIPNAGSALSHYRFDDVINPDAVGSYYVRIQTFSSIDGSGSALEDGGVVFAIVREFNVAAEVPPHLLFCAGVTIDGYDCQSATSFFIDLGEFSRSESKSASSQMLVTTNAGFGYSITLAGTTLTSGNNLIPPLLTRQASSPGSSQFGMNLRANTSPVIGTNPTGPGVAQIDTDYNTPNQYTFNPGDVVASSATSSDFRKMTVSYIANINASQPVGVYATTISFIALANF